MKRNAARASAVLAGILAFFCSFAQVKISGATVNSQSDNVTVHVTGEGLAKPKQIPGGNSYVIYEFAGELSGRSKTFTINKAGVVNAKIVPFSARPHRTRIVIKLSKPLTSSVSEDVTGWNIMFSAARVSPSSIANDSISMDEAIAELANSVNESVTKATSKIEATDTKTTVNKPANNTAKKPVKTNDDAEMKKAIATLEAEKSGVTTTSKPSVNTAASGNGTTNNKQPITDENPIISAPAAIIEKVTTVVEKVATETKNSSAKIGSDDGGKKKKPTKTPTDAFSALPPLNPNTGATPGFGVGKVNLDFSDADVVAVLKALSLQTNVNIIIAPGVTGGTPEAESKSSPVLPPAGENGTPPVSPQQPQAGSSDKSKPRRITLSLKNVTVEEALDLVTALSGLRYAKVGTSYIVTTKEEYGETVRMLADRAVGSNEVRVLPILSGQSAQIKDALYRWFGKGTIEVYLPSEAGSVTPTTTSTQGADGSKTSQTSMSKSPAESDPYLVLIGSKKWVEQAETLARQLDLDIIQTQKLKEQIDRQRAREKAEWERNGFGGTGARAIYEVQNGKADDLKKAISGAYVDVHVMSSPATSQKQVMILEGPEEQVGLAMDSLAQLDTGTVYGNDVAIYNVKFGDPRALREELITQVPGLRCSLGPSAAATPRLYKPGQSTKQGGQTTEGQGANGGSSTKSGETQGSGETTDVGVAGDRAEVKGLALPFQAMEQAAVPMRLILRGTDKQIEEALLYLHQIDVAPKQLALELRVMEMSKEDALSAGIDWNLFTGGAVKLLRLNNSQANPSNSVNVGIRGSGDVTATLDAIANKNNLIARPNFLAVDGRETELFVGDVIRYVESITSSQNGPTITAKELRVGVRLAVLPRIGDDGNITMDMRPVVSFLRGFSQPVEGVNLPQTSERVVQTTVNVKSGETIALGGLIQDEDRKQMSGVPILMDLPIIGHFFRKTNNTHVKTEIVFFLTVRALEGPATGNNVPLPVKKDGGLKDGGGK